VIESARTGRVIRRLRRGRLRGGLAWSPRGRYLAFDTTNGRRRAHRLYRYDLRTGKLKVVSRRRAYQFVFTPRGHLVYLTGQGMYRAWRDIRLWQAGRSSPLLRLPDRGGRRRGRRQRVWLTPRHLLVRVPALAGGRSPASASFWVTRIVAGGSPPVRRVRQRRQKRQQRRGRRGRPGRPVPRTRQIKPVLAGGSRGVGVAVLSPAGDRLCYLSGAQARCVDLASGRDRVVLRSLERCPLRFGPKRRPFSPDGRYLAAMGCAGGSRRHLQTTTSSRA
jgi:dipeptidyl aminopeptidase/acylaminoacyl peptidase